MVDVLNEAHASALDLAQAALRSFASHIPANIEVEDEDEVVIDDDESDVDSESDTEEGKWQGRRFVW